MKQALKPVRPLGDLLRVLAAPAIWFMHLVVIYGAEALICTGPSPSGRPAMVWVAAVATAVALIGLVLSAAVLIRPSFIIAAGPGDHGSKFLPGAALALTVLSALAVIWVALPTAALPACASPAG